MGAARCAPILAGMLIAACQHAPSRSPEPAPQAARAVEPAPPADRPEDRRAIAIVALRYVLKEERPFDPIDLILVDPGGERPWLREALRSVAPGGARVETYHRWWQNPELLARLPTHCQHGRFIRVEEDHQMHWLRVEADGEETRVLPQFHDFGGILYDVDEIVFEGPDLATVKVRVVLHLLGARGHEYRVETTPDGWRVKDPGPMGGRRWLSDGIRMRPRSGALAASPRPMTWPRTGSRPDGSHQRVPRTAAGG